VVQYASHDGLVAEHLQLGMRTSIRSPRLVIRYGGSHASKDVAACALSLSSNLPKTATAAARDPCLRWLSLVMHR
jgi:hypothetical protein